MKPLPPLNNCTVAVIGIGYVGLPLSVEFGKSQSCKISGKKLDRKVIGYDTNTERIEELCRQYDKTNEIGEHELRIAVNLEFTSDEKKLVDADVFKIGRAHV